MKYHKAQDGEWLQPTMKGHRLACCDCGLVHEIDFKIVGRRIQLRATRNPRATAAKRRGLNQA